MRRTDDDVSQLHAERLRVVRTQYALILPEVISKEPLGPVVRQGDYRSRSISSSGTFYALINAEELGVEQQSIDEAMKSWKPGRAAHCRYRRVPLRKQLALKNNRLACAGEGRRQLRRSLRAQRRIAIETRDSPRLKRALDEWWSSIGSTDTIATEANPMALNFAVGRGQGVAAAIAGRRAQGRHAWRGQGRQGCAP